VRSESTPEPGRSGASQFAEDPGKVALIGKAVLGGNDHERLQRAKTVTGGLSFKHVSIRFNSKKFNLFKTAASRKVSLFRIQL
jgi:hypothetical protein